MLPSRVGPACPERLAMNDGYDEYLEWKYSEQTRLRAAIERAETLRIDAMRSGTASALTHEHLATQPAHAMPRARHRADGGLAMTTIICLVVLAGLNWALLRWLGNNVKGCDWGRPQRVRRLLRSQVRVDVSEAVARAIGNRWP
jgi:hypothetical protein